MAGIRKRLVNLLAVAVLAAVLVVAPQRPAQALQIIADVSTAAGSTCVVTSSGAGYCWGENDDGQLGNGTTSETALPTLVSGGLTWKQIDDSKTGETVRL